MKKIFAASAVVLTTAVLTAQNYQPSPDLDALHVPFDGALWQFLKKL